MAISSLLGNSSGSRILNSLKLVHVIVRNAIQNTVTTVYPS